VWGCWCGYLSAARCRLVVVESYHNGRSYILITRSWMTDVVAAAGKTVVREDDLAEILPMASRHMSLTNSRTSARPMDSRPADTEHVAPLQATSPSHSAACRQYSNTRTHARTRARARPFNGPFSGTTRVSQHQKGKTNLDFTEARDSEWQWHQLSHMQVCTLLQTNNHASTPLINFYRP